MSKIKHILFDCDGVLVDTEYVAAVKMSQALRDLGQPVSVDYYMNNLSGSTFSAIIEKYFADQIPDSDKFEIINKVEQQVAEDVQLISGMDNVVNAIHLPLSVVSNSSRATVSHALKTTGIEHYFSDRIFSSEQVARPKPAPDLYQFALGSLKLRHEELLVIEDSITGVQAARSAGLDVIGFAGGSHILPGHADKLLQLGVLQVAMNSDELGYFVRIKIGST